MHSTICPPPFSPLLLTLEKQVCEMETPLVTQDFVTAKVSR